MYIHRRRKNNIDKTVQEVLEMADGKSKLYNGNRKDLVFRDNDDPTISFKSISNKYLLKYNL